MAAPQARAPELPRPARASTEVVLTTFNVAEAESKLIVSALEAAGGNRTRAAGLLGMSVRALRNKLNTPAEGVPANEG